MTNGTFVRVPLTLVSSAAARRSIVVSQLPPATGWNIYAARRLEALETNPECFKEGGYEEELQFDEAEWKARLRWMYFAHTLPEAAAEDDDCPTPHPVADFEPTIENTVAMVGVIPETLCRGLHEGRGHCDVGVVVSLWTVPTHRRQGIGEALMRYVLVHHGRTDGSCIGYHRWMDFPHAEEPTMAPDKKVSSFVSWYGLEVYEKNLSAVAAYEKIGFRRVEPKAKMSNCCCEVTMAYRSSRCLPSTQTNSEAWVAEHHPF